MRSNEPTSAWIITSFASSSFRLTRQSTMTITYKHLYRPGWWYWTCFRTLSYGCEYETLRSHDTRSPPPFLASWSAGSCGSRFRFGFFSQPFFFLAQHIDWGWVRLVSPLDTCVYFGVTQNMFLSHVRQIKLASISRRASIKGKRKALLWLYTRTRAFWCNCRWTNVALIRIPSSVVYGHKKSYWCVRMSLWPATLWAHIKRHVFALRSAGFHVTHFVFSSDGRAHEIDIIPHRMNEHTFNSCIVYMRETVNKYKQ